ncbi:hypothetical protein [Siculibacillus lacustris]|uniref:hypothetical protein n=1 Tax=Siculibacillus lacustris TaxID=1549641 RepID=UPI00103ED946|nr:hypothetical protein [Siculibacillus lacustris]
MEYRIARIEFEDQGDRSDFLVARLNEFAKDGWRVASIDLTPHPSFSAKSLPVLLERTPK